MITCTSRLVADATEPPGGWPPTGSIMAPCAHTGWASIATESATIAMETMLYFVTLDSCALKIEVLQWHVREYLQPLAARVKVPRCRCHGAG
jgi:hypothetical protein